MLYNYTVHVWTMNFKWPKFKIENEPTNSLHGVYFFSVKVWSALITWCIVEDNQNVYMTLEKIYLFCQSGWNRTLKIHVNMLVWLKSHQMEFLKVELTNPDNVIGNQITPACLHLNQTQTGLNILCMINSYCSVFEQQFSIFNSIPLFEVCAWKIFFEGRSPFLL